MSDETSSGNTTPRRSVITVRRPEFPFDDSIPKHWFGGNAIRSHLFNGLNLLFPEGERFFVRSVHDHLDRIKDPVLLEQVRGFSAQEGWHARQHERFFATLEAQGYRIRPFLERFQRFVERASRISPASLRLSVTAAAEHYTAVFSHYSQTHDDVDWAHPTMRSLILWHTLEEMEHKAVAFDVLRATHPGYLLRVLGFAIAGVLVLASTAAAARMLLKQDRLSRAELRRHRSDFRRMMRQSNPLKAMVPEIFAYLSPGFHPSQVDDLDIAQRRVASLDLGPPGTT